MSTGDDIDAGPDREAGALDASAAVTGPDPFVVAVGASAGGQDAVAAVLQHLPETPSAAYVLALADGLEHERDTHLLARLSSLTSWPTIQPSHGDAVRPGFVYVVPPGHVAEVWDGHFRIEPWAEETSSGVGIDVLFSSVADSHGSRCAGLILAGTENSGVRGLRAIRAAGGVTLAQDPETARFDAMPCAAVAAGVDLVVAPQEAGSRLKSVIERIDDGSPPQVDADTLDLIIAEVRSQSGRDLSPYKKATVLRRVQRRAAIRNLTDLRAYLDYAREHPREITDLTRDILVSVTRFFRDAGAFESLRRVIEDLVVRKDDGEPIRVWVPACATGEEAYSIAILFAEALGPRFDRANFVVYATDIDPEAVELARRGVFGASSLRIVNRDFVNRYFYRDRETHIVKKALRERMIFAPHDVVDDPPFAQLDLVACRNLLIYLEPRAQTEVLRSFHYALHPGACLFLGKSESLGAATDLFDPISKAHRIFRRRDGATQSLKRSARSATARATGGSPRGRVARSSHRDAVAHAIADRLEWPAVLVDDRREILYVRGDVTDFFNLREGDAALSAVDLAVPDLRPILRSAIHRATREAQPVTKPRVRVPGRDGHHRLVDLEVIPADHLVDREGALFVIFVPWTWSSSELEDLSLAAPADARTRELERELAATQENLQDAITQLEDANRELQGLNQELYASNEELQSTNEEFETANEELQATNSELSTVNEELRSKTSALDAANAELRNILACIAHPLVVVDRDLRIQQLSRAAIQELGLDASSTGLRLPAVAEHPVLRQLLPDLEAVLSAGSHQSRELEHAGRTFHAEVHSFEHGGQSAGALLLLRDDTTIRRREREFRNLADNSPDVVTRYDRQLRHVYVNETLEKLTGRPREAWIGYRNSELDLPATIYEPLEAAVHQAFETAQDQTVEFEYVSRFGPRFLQSRIVPESDGAGEVTSVLSVAVDLTERVAVTRALEQERARTTALLRSISDGFFALDRDLTVTYFNEEASRLLARDPARIVGRPLFEAFPEAAGSVFEENYRKALSERSPLTFETYFAPYDDWYDVRVYPSDEGISVFFQVISEKKRLQEEQTRLEREFQHAQKMQALGTLSGGVAHEFNNLLMAILGFTELVLARDDLAAEAAEDLGEVLVAVERGRSLVDQILAFSRKTAGIKRPVQVNDAVSRVLRILSSTLPRRIAVESRLDPGLPSVLADPGQLEQVALNLASNAQDAIAEAGTIEMTTRFERLDEQQLAVGGEVPPGDYVILTVRDDGVGMTEDVRVRAFDPFFTTKGPGEGTGLGLSTVYGIVRAHGGSIGCRSDPEGGTTFQVYLPVDAAPARSDLFPSVPPEVEPARGRSELILVADDEEALRHYYKRLLEQSGYRVLLAASAEEVLQMARDYRERVAAVILDLGMPGMGGLGALETMQAERLRIPTVIATGYAAPETALASQEAGAKAVLRKPFDRESLLRALQGALQSSGGG